jgi:hypothetical protein
MVRKGEDVRCFGFLNDSAIRPWLEYDGLLVICLEFAGATLHKQLQKQAKS